jgi:hypothetical protein
MEGAEQVNNLISRNDAWPPEAFERIDNPTMEDLLDPARMKILCRQYTQEQNRRHEPEVRALLAAGWIAEPVRADSDPWQWAWRRPPRRPGSKGMRFASTGQAFNALKKEQSNG